jgi:outer membrane protein OmpA-like peptidoglycan-associated protein
VFHVNLACGYAIPAYSRDLLIQHACWLRTHEKAKVDIEAHTITAGTREYNLGRGERIGNAVESFMLGVGDSNTQVNVVSFGEERLIVEPINYYEDAKNERFVLKYHSPVSMKLVEFEPGRCDSVIADSTLEENIALLKSNPSIVVTIEGYSEAGESGGLQELSDCRALVVYKRLVGAGIASDRIRSIKGLGATARSKSLVVLVPELDVSREKGA